MIGVVAADLTHDPGRVFEPTLTSIRTAATSIADHVIRTPTVALDRLSERLGLPVVGKLESLQHTGSFKVRGAFYRMLQLEDEESTAGVVAVSGGNHGLAVAYAARKLGIPATVLMPASAAEASIRQVRADGATLVVLDTIQEVFRRAADELAAGKVMIHPFDDPAVISAQGTLGLELLEDAPTITDVIASIGGGGMISGVACALKAVDPAIRVWGVETAGADVMSRSLAAGQPVSLDAITSIATTLGAPMTSPRTLAAVQDLVEDVIVVSDEEAVRGIEVLAHAAKLVTEPAAACTWAAAERLRPRLPDHARLALVICGGNADLDDIERWRTRFLG